VGIPHYQPGVVPDEITDISEYRDPDSSPYTREKEKSELVHLGETCRKGNILTNHREQSPYEGAYLSVLGKETLHPQKL